MFFLIIHLFVADAPPNTAAQATVLLLIECGVESGYINPNYGLIGHRQGTATECPGNAYYDLIQSWPHYNPNP
jgi:N-acetylmuramoyl-L-alanine amidase